jgi:sterol desaturase/sphingolipid hydroxylase (fatty acid hydroxylase superfamily)
MPAFVQCLVGFAGGLLGWTLLEYIIHYPLGHLPKGKTLISAEHIRHHREIQYFSPLALKIRGTVPVLGIVGGVVWLLAGPWAALGATLAISIGWVTYEGLHKSIHVRGPRTAYGRWATRHHLYHHFMRPDRNHGVTTPLWDWVFRTYVPVEQVLLREHEIAAIPWLAEAFADPGSAPRYAQTYALRKPGKNPPAPPQL